MFPKMSWAKAAAIVAGVHLAVPQMLTYAAEPAAKGAVEKKAAKAPADVVLTSAGKLTGRVITAEGTPVDGATVTLTQNGKDVGRTTSDATGNFAMASVKGGVYQVSAGPTTQVVRVWQPEAAPPTARTSATIVQGTVVRGQDEWDYFETDEMVIAAVATAGLIVGIAALVEADDDDNGGPASP
jgi:hypothetical protein